MSDHGETGIWHRDKLRQQQCPRWRRQGELGDRVSRTNQCSQVPQVHTRHAGNVEQTFCDGYCVPPSLWFHALRLVSTMLAEVM
jgi:hypothetical protein